MVSQPQVIFKTGDGGEKLEPYEEVVIDLDEAYSGAIIEELGRRGGRMQEMGPAGEGRMRLEYLCPARGLIGYRSQFLTDTRGTGILNHNFKNYGPFAGTIRARAERRAHLRRTTARPTPTASSTCRSAGSSSSGRQIKVYGGQIIGLHSRDNDLIVNPSKAKKLTNIRTTAADEKLFLTTAARLHAGVGAGVHQRRRAGRGHAGRDPPAQALPRPQRAQAPREGPRRRRGLIRFPLPLAGEGQGEGKPCSARGRAPACRRRLTPFPSRIPRAVRGRASGPARPRSCCTA